MNNVIERLRTLPNVNRSISPTPFHRLDNLSAKLGIDLWCKRDDLTGFGFGGNKTRKLDFLIADAIKEGATGLVATGAIQSNFCRITSAYASAPNLSCTLILGGMADKLYTGNPLLDMLYGARFVYVESDDWAEWDRTAKRITAEMQVDGQKLYRMPLGGSTSVGALGYVHCFAELMDDFQRVNVNPASIYVASSSAGTHAGLLAGQAAYGWGGSIRAIAVAKNAYQLKKEAFMLAAQTGNHIEAKVDNQNVLVDDSYLGDGYGIESGEALEAQRMFAQTEGIILDTVYTAKAAAGIIGDIRKGIIEPGQTVVFLHTGGAPKLFA